MARPPRRNDSSRLRWSTSENRVVQRRYWSAGWWDDGCRYWRRFLNRESAVHRLWNRGLFTGKRLINY